MPMSPNHIIRPRGRQSPGAYFEVSCKQETSSGLSIGKNSILETTLKIRRGLGFQIQFLTIRIFLV